MAIGRSTSMLLLLLLVLLLSLNSGAFGAQDGERRSFSGTRVLCHTCDVDFSVDKYDANNSCLIGVGDKDTATCSATSNYCKVEVARLNGVLVSFSRKCADICAFGCNEKGFGINRRTCTYCCQRNPECGESNRQI